MGLLTSSLSTDVLLIFLVTLFCLSYIYVQNLYRYWEKKRVPFVKPIFPFGLLTENFFRQKSYAETIKETHLRMRESKYIGFFSFFSPSIIINDLDIIKHVLIKDFNSFPDRGIYSNKKVDPLSAHLIATDGPDWKLLRSKLNRIFTISKLKNIFDVFIKCEQQFQNYVATESAKSEALEWKDVFSRYGYEVFAKAAFGLETNTFEKGSSQIFDMIRQVLEPSFLQGLRMSVSFYSSSLAKRLNMRVFPKHVTDFYMGVFNDTVHYRKTNNVFRNDLMQLLIELMEGEVLQNTNEKSIKETNTSLSVNDVAAQGLMFSLAGYEAPSCALIFCAYELAMNPGIQKRLHEEIDGLEGGITYEKLHGMQYLDMIISETLRKYPPVGLCKRICTEDYKVPGSDLVIEKGTIVVIPVHGMHMNPDFFPEPEKFIPERFSKENYKNIKPYSYLPFGEGPRICMGIKFSSMMTKLFIVQLLKKFQLEISEKTSIPVVFAHNGILTNSKGGMWLRAVERSL